jgi:glyoxylase-like metal-dependent hydrolase (beta-lactamase superfamily II)
MNRRGFVRAGASCAAQLAAWSAVVPPGVRSVFAATPRGRVVEDEPWGRLERVGEGVCALISTPFAEGPDAHRTVANGGIVAGRDGVLLIEGLASDAGAQWLTASARRLTGRAPTHVVLTHYHGDHSSGLAAYRGSGASESRPIYVTTAATRALLRDPLVQLLGDAELVSPGAAPAIDLAGRRVTLTHRSGHTASDLTVTVDEPRVVFCGDLLWNGIFPNYRDAVPSVLSQEVRAMLGDSRATAVPGHGSIPSPAEAADYVALLDLVEAAARRAFAAGTPAAEAAREFSVPPSLGQWRLFGAAYYQVALSAWERELRKD